MSFIDNVIVNSYSNYNISLSTNDSFKIVDVLSGELNININGEYYSMFKNNVILFTPNSLISCESYDDAKILEIVFDKNEFKDVYSILINKRISNPVITDKNIFSVLSNISNSNSIFINKAYVYQFIDYYLSNVSFDKSNDYNLLNKIFIYLNDNYQDPNLSLMSLSVYLGLNYNYVSKLFKDNFKSQFKETINEIRIEKAKTSLLDNENSITEVAYASGFSSIRSFNRNFKTLTGLTPKEYRKKEAQ